jgi:hypothetical protein
MVLVVGCHERKLEEKVIVLSPSFVGFIRFIRFFFGPFFEFENRSS